MWERWELEKAMEVYRANDCLVISDEIWSDIILNGHKHIPTQSVSEDARSRTVACMPPAKPLTWRAWWVVTILFITLPAGPRACQKQQAAL